MKAKDKIFINVTNKDIYTELKELHTKLDEFMKSNTSQHVGITQRQDKTNGKVKLGFWVATTAITIGAMALGFLFEHIGRG